jgi:ATP-binding cassette subfamily C protein CydC
MRDLARLIRLFFRIAALRILAGVVLGVATALFGAMLLAAAGWLIAGSYLAGITGVAFNSFTPSGHIRTAALGRALGRYGERLVSHDATLRVLAGLRVAVFRGLAARPATGSAAMLGRVTAEVDALDGLVLRLIAPALAAGLGLVVLAFAIGWLAPLVALAVLLPVAAGGAMLPLALGLAGRRDARRKAAALDALRARLVDLDRGQAALAATGRLDAQVAAVALAGARIATAERRMIRRDALAIAGATAGATLAVAGGTLASAGLLGEGLIAAPVVAVVALAAFGSAELFAPLRGGLRDLGRTLIAARRVARLTAHAPLAPAVQRRDGTIAFEGVSFRWAPERAPVIAGFDAALPAGARVAVVGPSGAGKSTLLAMLAGLVAPSDGRVLVGGQPPGLGLAGGVGVLSQRTVLFRDTIAANVRLGRPGASDDEVGEALELAGVAPVLQRLPLGARAMLGEGGAGLSGGEKRRLALARLIASRPEVVLLDEPTEGLDAETAAEVWAAIAGWIGGRTMVVAAHRRRDAGLAEEVWVVGEDGGVERAVRGSPLFAEVVATLKD